MREGLWTMLLGAGVDPELSKKLSWWPILEENCLVATIHASSRPHPGRDPADQCLTRS
jgi:hypothetical protein